MARILFSLLLILVELFPILYKLQRGRTLADELAVHHEAIVSARLNPPFARRLRARRIGTRGPGRSARSPD